MDLTEFLTARLDEEHAAAQASYDEATDYRIVGSARTELHFAHWKPDRVLAEVDAKRQLLHWAQTWLDRDVAPWNAEVPKLLALPYADHPQFDEAWRP